MIYADYNASSRPHPKVIQYLTNRLNMDLFANPNSIHTYGRKINSAIEKSRILSAKILGCKSHQIIFNSGASEGIAHVFHSVLKGKNKGIIVSSGIEHSAIVNNLDCAKKRGFEIKIISTNEDGIINLKEYEEFVLANKENIVLVTLMAANNETGVIQPFKEFAKIANENKIPIFSDTTQFVGKHNFSFKESGLDYAVVSSHKIGSIIGAGILIAKTPEMLNCFIMGGGQENGKRGGTQNYLGIECMAMALSIFEETKSSLEILETRRKKLEENLKKAFPDYTIMGEKAPRLAGTTLAGIPGIHGQAVQIELEARDIYVSTSSACSDNEPATSKVLKSMNKDDQIGRAVIRISFCHESTQQDFDHLEKSLIEIYTKLRKIKY